MRPIFLTLALLPLLVFGQNSAPKFICVRGESEINLTPDWIELTVTYSETENIKKENELQQKEADLINLLKNFSIDIKKLSVDNFNANRNGYYGSSNKVRMVKVFKLQLDDIDIADSLILKLFEAGADNVSVTNLQSNRLEETRLDATKIALDKAKKKAEIMASHSASRLGQILEINEIHSTPFNGADAYRSYPFQSFKAYGVNQMIDNNTEHIGIRKIRVKYAVDVKFELK